MSSRFDAAVAAICAESGWTPSGPDAAGQVSFALREMNFTLSAPNDRHLCFIYALLTLAPDDAPGVKARKLARMAAAAARERKTILSFHEGVFHLHVVVDMATTRAEEIPAVCQDFLNDCDWWRQNGSFFE
jgi:hypothetical protein